VHAQRQENLLTDKVFPGRTGQPAREVTRHHVHQIIVLPPLPEIGTERQMLQSIKYLFAAVSCEHPEHIVSRQSREMRVQIAHSDFFADLRIA